MFVNSYSFQLFGLNVLCNGQVLWAKTRLVVPGSKSHTRIHTRKFYLSFDLIDGQQWPLRRQAIQLTSFCYLVLTKIGEAWDSSEQVLTGFYIYLPK